METEAIIPDASKIRTTEQELLDSIDFLQGANNDALMIPLSTVNQAVVDVVDKNSALIGKLQGKILRKLDHATTKNLDALDGVYTRLLAGLDAYQYDAHYLLQQLAVKGGITQAGQPLETALLEQVTRAPELAYGATLVLAVKEAIPFFEQLIQVLREIRDKLGERVVTPAPTTPIIAGDPDHDDEAAAADKPLPQDWFDHGNSIPGRGGAKSLGTRADERG